MLIHVGTRDDFEEGERPCDALVAMWPAAAREHTTVRYVEGATHDFDSQKSGGQAYDKFAHGWTWRDGKRGPEPQGCS